MLQQTINDAEVRLNIKLKEDKAMSIHHNPNDSFDQSPGWTNEPRQESHDNIYMKVGYLQMWLLPFSPGINTLITYLVEQLSNRRQR